MYTVKQLPEFIAWIDSIKDGLTVMRLRKRLRKVTLGNLGDVKPVAEGVWEMREFLVLAGVCITSSTVMC